MAMVSSKVGRPSPTVVAASLVPGTGSAEKSGPAVSERPPERIERSRDERRNPWERREASFPATKLLEVSGLRGR